MYSVATAASTSPFCLSETDIRVLTCVHRFQYLTAHQLGRLLYPTYRDDDRHARRRLHRLAEAGLLLRLRALPVPRFGAAPRVFTLARPGYRLLDGLGIPAPAYHRPAEEHKKAENFPFMQHTLAVVDGLITMERACQAVGFTMPQVLTERDLKRDPVRVDVPSRGGTGEPARKTAVIPDAWVQIATGKRAPYCIALELDRATEWQRRWRGKVAALAAWVQGPYQHAFGANNVTIAVLAPHPQRVADLLTWTQDELSRRDLADLVGLFLFTPLAPATTDPVHWLCGTHWISGTGEQVSLLPAPAPAVPLVQLVPR